MRRDGTFFDASCTTTPIVDNHRVVAVLTAFHDTDRRRRAERELSNFLQTVREEERTRIARELHDELGQTLNVLKMDLTWLMSRFTDAQDDLVAKADSMMTVIDSLVDSIRRISANLRPGLLDDLGLTAAAEWLLEEFHERTGVRYTLKMSHDESDFDAGLATTLFRILQEAVTNVSRHAQASRLDVELAERGGQIMLNVKDDGIGFDPREAGGKRKSLGLLGIRERVTSLGGTLEIIGRPGQGTELRIVLPKTPNGEMTHEHDKSTAG